MTTKIGRFCYRHRWAVTSGWLVIAIGLLVLGFPRGAPTTNACTGGTRGSARPAALLSAHSPDQQGSSLTLAIHADAGVEDPAVQAGVREVLAIADRAPHVVRVDDPYQLPGHVSKDGTTAFAAAALDVKDQHMPVTATRDLLTQVRAASHDGVTFALGGAAVNNAETPGGGASDGIGMTAALVVLLVAFGSLLAAVLPLVTAVFGIGVGLAGAMLLNHVVPSPGFTPILAAMIGLGVGVDYALFIVTRYREGLAGGQEPSAAAAHSIATAGRAVLFAGGTVVVGLLGLLLMGQPLLRGAAGFGEGYDAPLFIVTPPSSASSVAAAVGGTPGIASVTPPKASADGAVALIVAYPTTSAQAASTTALVKHLRADVVPAGVSIG